MTMTIFENGAVLTQNIPKKLTKIFPGKEFPPPNSGFYWRCSLDEAGFDAACSSNFKHVSYSTNF